MRSLGSARPCADFVRPLSRILAFAVVGVGASLHDPHSASLPPAPKKAGLCLFVVAEVWRGVELRPFGSLHRAATLCDRYRASMHDPHSASSPPSTKKAGLCLFRHSPAFFGADGGGRTRTVLLPTDFESVTSANSITSAY